MQKPDREIILTEIYFYIVIFGIQHRFKNLKLSIFSIIILSIFCGLNYYFLISSVIAIILSELITTIYGKIELKCAKHDYIFHLVVIPFILKFLLYKFVPQTKYELGIILSFVSWVGIWLILWTIDINKKNNLYYIFWAIPSILTFIVYIIIPNFHLIHILSSIIITTIIIIFIPINKFLNL